MDNTANHSDQKIPPYQQAANAKKAMKEQRIELVRRLMVRGVRNAEEIRVTLLRNDPPIDLTVRNIYRYKSIIKRRTVEKVATKMGLNKSIEELVIKLREDYDEVQRELWRVFHACRPDQASAKVAALREIRATADDWIERLQSLGMVYKAPDKHQMIGADGEPVDPLTVNVQALNAQFVSFIKSQWQDPVGATGSHEVVKRNEPPATT